MAIYSAYEGLTVAIGLYRDSVLGCAYRWRMGAYVLGSTRLLFLYCSMQQYTPGGYAGGL